ncbi:MAG TPA: hypothetical protein VFI34_10520 [Candidatus Limnocylindrales bacterium]|nr:hypothetical protein [Candidatus Limnocylindrales bacterium]
MDLAITMGLGGWAVLIIGALVFGAIVQYTTDAPTSFEWVVVAIAAGIGGLLASEFIVSLRTVEPVWDGLAVLPATLGGVVVGVVVEIASRIVTGGRPAGRHLTA